MIISPPFLPPKNAGETDVAWILRAMTGGSQPGQGLFPLSTAASWHGGLHLTAPSIAGHPDQHEPVRAIADGTVVYRRAPTPVSQDINHPLNYHSPHNTPQWTHDGVVVVKHETEIGEGTNASITYFSVTQHLSALDEHLPALNHRIWRKDKIGTAGSIFGEPNRVHFEIVAADDQIARICGRTGAQLNTAADGRTDALYGEVYVKLPSGTKWMVDVQFRDDRHPARNAAGEPGSTSAYTSTEDFYVGLQYALGDCTLTTYREDGTVVGRFTEPQQAEYALYQTATNRYPGCPSAGYELLRFGRVIGTDALSPAGAAHWRKVPYASGVAWVNLNAPGLHKFSDADLPHWCGWQMVGDDAEGDVRCDSALILGLLRKSYPQLQAKDSVGWLAAVADETCKARLKRLVCKFPSEWADEEVQIDQRYGWLKTLPEHERLEEDDYAAFKAFAKKLGFWSAAGIQGLAANHWHLNPREFVQHFRRCGWLKRDEMVQLIPSHAIRRAGGTDYWERVNYARPPGDMLSAQGMFLNQMIRKVGINTPERMAGFFGNAIQETGWFSLLAEGSPEKRWYWPWYGRGFFQLTHAGSYVSYWRWRGRTVPDRLLAALAAAATRAHAVNSHTGLDDGHFHELTAQMVDWRDDVARRDHVDAAGSASWYWVMLRMASYSDGVHVLERQQVDAHTGGRTSPTTVRCYYRSSAFWRCSASVNLPGAISQPWNSALNGFVDRCCAYAAVLAATGEYRFPAADHGIALEFPEFMSPRR